MIRTCILFALAVPACSPNGSEATAPASQDASESSQDEGQTGPSDEVANVTAVTVTGAPGAYTFGATLESPDTGCGQYADWWEVIDEDGSLVYRRILGHSHVDEQPFTRTGGPVDVAEDQRVFVRAHMNVAGYGGQVFGGTAEAGFNAVADVPTTDPALETQAPQPDGCAF